jgi:hypothetical protein
MKRYSIISIILIVIIGLFTYINTNSTTTFNLFGINITLLNAVWTMLFLSIFYLVSIIYFAIDKFKNFRFSKNVKKDIQNISKNIQNRVFYKEKLLPVTILKDIDELVKMIDGLCITPKNSETFPFMDDLIKLQNGEVIDTKKYKLNKTNPWVLKNLENGIKKEDIALAKEALDTPLKDKAMQLLAKKLPIKEILSKNYPITKDTILNNLDSKELSQLIEKSNLTDKEYIQIAQTLHKTSQNPEFLLSIFKNRPIPYIYLLIEYEMIDKAMDVVKENDIKFFEYYLLLRKNGIKIGIKDYMDVTI